MAYLVIAYPQLFQKDFDWIQEYRKKNDERYFDVVQPHFTLIFPVHDINQDVFVKEIKKQIHQVKRVDFEIKVATINQDDSGEYYHEFLVPDKGYSDIVKLHDKLYSGALLPHLRLDINFIPHIGIGNSNEASVSKQRIDELNAQDIQITGTIESLDIIEYKDGTVRTLEKIELGV